MRLHHSLTLALALPLFLLAPARAQTQKYFLSGHVASASIQNSLFAPHVNVGDSVGGYFQFNPATAGGGVNGPVEIDIDGDAWYNDAYTWTGGLPSSGTTQLHGDIRTGAGPHGTTDSAIYLTLANGTGTFTIHAVGFIGATPNDVLIRGDIQTSPAPEPGGLALAVPCLLPGVWWVRNRRSVSPAA